MLKSKATHTCLDVFLRESPVGGVVLCSGQFVKAWSKTMGVLALSSGESELAAVVRAVVRTATEGLGLQSIQSDFGLFGHVAIKSDATVAIGMVHRLGLGKFDSWLWEIDGFSITFGRGKFESPKCQDWRTILLTTRCELEPNGLQP